MSKLKKEVESRFEQMLTKFSIEAGANPVPVDYVLKMFKEFAPDLPASKSLMGRLLSKKFLKKQIHFYAGSELTQCYYLNRDITLIAKKD